MDGFSFADALPYAFGYGFAIVAGHLLVKMNTDALWDGFGRLKEKRRPWHPAFLGILERLLYISAMGLNKPEFIVGWLALKAVPQWKRWSEDTATAGGKRIEGRAIFNVFLIGNALSVVFALVGAQSIDWFKNRQMPKAVLVYLAVIVGSIASCHYTSVRNRADVKARAKLGRAPGNL